jgi:hypothetical protein
MIGLKKNIETKRNIPGSAKEQIIGISATPGTNKNTY